MHVIDRILLDNSGRISIAKLFNNNPPEKVDIFYDTELREIVVKPYVKDSGYISRKTDPQSRISLAPWMRAAFADKIYLVVEDGVRKLKIIDSI